ncbi:MAG: hypothetical protein V3571_05900 [Pseudodesulfovibrio sp.]
MTESLWDRFMRQLTESGKLDEFCDLADADLDAWLEANHMGVTVDQLVASAPKVRLDDDTLDALSGGRFVIHALNECITGIRRPIF